MASTPAARRPRETAGDGGGGIPTASTSHLHPHLHRLLSPSAVLLALLSLALVALAAREIEAERIAGDFATAWERSDYPRMHALLTPGSRRRVSASMLARAYQRAREAATAAAVRVGEPQARGEEVRLPVAIETRVFGDVRGEVVLPLSDGAVAWDRHLVFPGLREGEPLHRRATAPPRAAILDRNDKPIVSGPASDRSVRAPGVESLAGEIGRPQTREERREAYLRGLDPRALVGVSGLESMLEKEVAGTPGGVLLAGNRTVATSRPLPSPAVRSTIDLGLQAVGDRALGGRTGGIAAIDAQTAEIRALSGLAFSALQPPGSTFKIVTATAALEGAAVDPSTPFPVERGARVEGRWIENADGEVCGGSFVDSFAHSCNSVFAPLGVRVGAERLVRVAERYGFNAPPSIRRAETSTLPEAEDIGSELELAVTAIGQGRVLATPLQLASMAQTVASQGRRWAPTVLDAPRGTPSRVTSPPVARALGEMMVAVVERGTGHRAVLAPVRVAGKTGTAELGGSDGQSQADTDAWFTAYAPAERPRIAVAVMLVRQGQGGETAAPVAREVLKAGLG